MPDKKLYILNLEDDPNDTELIQARLEEEGTACEITRVETEGDFVAALEQGGFDLLLADYKLPGFDGLSALALAKEKCPDIPFVFVSGSIGEDVAIEALKHGATDYVLKDKILRLGSAVRRTLKEAEGRRQRKKAEERLTELNKCFLEFGPDPLLNINRLVALGGKLLGGTNALYNRLDKEMLCSWGQWNMPQDYNAVDAPGGHICNDVINSKSDEVFVVRNLPETRYARTDPNVSRYKLQTYVGIAVKFGSAYIGTLCIVYQKDFVPGDDDKNILGIIASAIGVEEERKLSEDALMKSEELYRRIFSTAGDAMFLLDQSNGAVLDSNDAASRMYGYNREEFLQLNNTDLSAEPDKTSRAIKEELNLVPIRYHRKKDGTVFPVEITVSYYDQEGRRVCVVDIRDITVRMKQENSLRELSHKLELILNSAGEGIYGLDMEGRVTFINQAGAGMLGWEKEELIGRSCHETWHYSKSDKTPFPAGECGLLSMMKDGIAKTVYDAIFWRKDGTSFPVEYTTTPIFENEQLNGAVVSFMDETGRKKLEDQLRQAQKMEAIGRLTGGIAHDFNNILNVILGYGAMVWSSLGDEHPSRALINEVLNAAEKAANLTKRLLTFSRKQAADMKPADVNEIVIGIEKMLRRIIGEDIELITNLTGKKMLIMADFGQMEQVLMNLAVNARDAMPAGGSLTISTEPRELDADFFDAYGYGEPGRYALIQVSDSGGGIDAETQSKIFEPFFTTKGVGEGTGLGLSMAYGILKQHNGYIKVYSELGKGSTFKILIPLTEETAEKEVQAEPPVLSEGGRETILVAEDDASLRKLSRIILESFGYSVITAEDGEDALRKYSENRDRIRLVILDMIMPRKSGREAYEEIRKIDPDIRTLFASGYTMDLTDKGEMIEEGTDFLHKPFSSKDLLRKVREVLDR